MCKVSGSCNASTCPALGTRSASVTVRYQGLEKSFAVYAEDRTTSVGGGGGIED